MKAIKILKAILEEDERLAKENGVSLTCEYCKLMNEAIKELENLSGSKQLVDNHTCEGCKWYEVRNHSASCNWCERHPSRQIRNINIKDYWESKE